MSGGGIDSLAVLLGDLDCIGDFSLDQKTDERVILLQRLSEVGADESVHNSLLIYRHHVVEAARKVQNDSRLLELAACNHGFESQLEKTPDGSTITLSGTVEIARKGLDITAKTMANITKQIFLLINQ